MPHQHPTHIICGFILLALPAIACSTEPSHPQFAHGSAILANGYKIEVEIADTETQREYGLMHRKTLNKNQGMLFVYPETARQGVWMKNTLLALDVLFLTEHGQVTETLENLQPCLTDPCPIYVSETKVRYMLEVPAGFAAYHNIEPGQELILDYRH